jgi:hypothetical protein
MCAAALDNLSTHARQHDVKFFLYHFQHMQDTDIAELNDLRRIK